MKCMIDNIVVDISFNQLGGICTYGFLERVNNELIPNHLFKMSIILVSQLWVRIMQGLVSCWKYEIVAQVSYNMPGLLPSCPLL